MVLNEKTYNANLPVNYVLEDNPASNFLVVVFSGFNSIELKIKYSYNYMRTLSNVKCNKLFILDNYGPRGCYYIGKDMNFEVERAVISLIEYISSKLNISYSNIISAGSSKGGSAALYFGLKYNFGHIISGAPQVKIADYVIKTTKETAEYMLGSIDSYENINKLNSIIMEHIDNKINSELILFSSKNDWQYEEHIIPFIQNLDGREIKYSLFLEDSMLSHGEISKYFPDFLLNSILKIIGDFTIKNCSINMLDNGEITINTEIMGTRPLINFVINKQKNEYYKQIINTSDSSYKIFEPGIYTVKLEFLNKNDVIYSVISNKQIIGLDLLKYEGYTFNISGNLLTFELDIETRNKLTYAFYLLKDNNVIDKKWYTPRNTYQYSLFENGLYQVQFFIKVGNHIIIDHSIAKEFKY